METPAQVSATQPPQPEITKSGGGKRLLFFFIVLVLLIGPWVFEFGLLDLLRDQPKDYIPPVATKSAKPKAPTFTKEELIDSFVNTAIFDVKEQEICITRWNKAVVTIGFAQAPTENIKKYVDEYVEQFNSVSNSVKLVGIDQGQADITIQLLSESKYLNVANTERTKKARGFARWEYNKGSCETYTGGAYFNMTQLTAALAQKIIIWHELQHNMGFWGHSELNACHLHGMACDLKEFGEIEKNFIDMLYNSGLPLCSKAQAAKTYLLNNWQKKYNDN